MSPNRRDFIKIVVAGAVASGCPVDLSLLAQTAGHGVELDSEHNTICHQVRDGFLFNIPPVSKRHEVVIVGGGVSGLTAAYLLQPRDFLLLEKETHWGGNAYEMNYNGAYYATGAAFLDNEQEGEFANEIGLKPFPVNDWDGSIIKGEFIPDTWGENIDKLPYPEATRESFKKFKNELLAIDLSKRAKELDNIPLTHFMQGYAPEIKEWWDAYCPSNWGSQSHDTAALVAVSDLQYFAGDKREDTRLTWPGGNGALTAKIAELLTSNHAAHMLAGATTIAVTPQQNEVQVTYMHDGQLTTVAAKGVIMATPKFITARLVSGIPDKQKDAMKKIRYAPYPVVNLIFDKPVFNKGYDTWCPGNTFTDFIVADWVVRNQPGYEQKYNILTFYTPMREEQRSELLTEQGAKSVARRVLRDFQKLFPGSDVDPLEAHIYRRGHPMFMVTPGNYTQVLPIARQPMEHVFFANTDSEGPVSTTYGGIQAARRAVSEFEHAIGKSSRRSAAARTS